MLLNDDHFILDNFEGTLDFLICLIQKDEIEVCAIPILGIIQQFICQMKGKAGAVDRGAEFIGSAAYLLWLKSKMLLPQEDAALEDEEGEEDPRFEIIHHLIDYCRFKEAAKELASRQDKQQACYFRGIEAPEWKKPMGIDHVSLDELSSLFKEMMKKAAQNIGQIHEENWRVCDKIRAIREKLCIGSSFLLVELFSSKTARLEIIVIFLAILELMKIGEIFVGRREQSTELWMFSRELTA